MTSSDDGIVVTQQADVLSAEELANAYQRWEAPRMVSVSDVEDGDSLLTVDAIEKLQQQAQEEGYKTGYEEGHKVGYAAGLESGQAEIQQQLSYLNKIIQTLNNPLQDLDQNIEQNLIQLVITMTRQLIRRELKIEPEHVIGAMRTALEALPVNDRKVKVFAHPQDIEIIQKGLSMEADDDKWQWLEDPLLTRGGVRVETADTTIDATVESRLNSLINQLLGEERSDGRGD